jgi:glycosyltransferase involved in cell wall biosynthesis/SAM-dependent methyltransferase
MNICTIIARNYLAFARVLATSFRQIHPDGTCTVLVIDDPSGFIDPAEEPFELLTIEEIGLPDAEQMAASYDVMELSTAVKPWLLKTLLARPGVDSVMYLDPDIKVFAPLDEIVERAVEHNVVLTPHFTAPLPRDGRKPSEEDILIAGSYNLGFIGLGDSRTASELLDWWAERLEKHCLNEPEQGQFVDQRWIDLAPGIWPGIDVIRDTTFNIAYWNLATRELSDSGDGGYLVDGRPLRFFHFSGFDPRHPTVLSKHQNRIDVTANPALTRICAEYAEALLAQGFEQAVAWPYGWNELPGGLQLDRAARKVFREGVEAGALTEPIWTEAGAERFVTYLEELKPGLRTNREVNRYAQALWETRPDFRLAFTSIEGEGGSAFVGWLRATAPDTGIAAELLPSAANGGAPEIRKPPTTKPGVNLVGYLNDARGIGEVGRQILEALRDADVPVATIDTPADPDQIAPVLGRVSEKDAPYDFNLICVNADMLPLVAGGLDQRLFEGRNSAGLWFWEVSHFPQQWEASFDYVDEVWVATEHVAEALRTLAPIPVHTIRMPIVPAPPEPASRAELGMPEGFCFLFTFDYRSVFRRKNPLGVVEAFRAAFEPGEGPSLVIKSICGDEFPAQREELAAAVADRPEIHLVEEMIPVGRKNAMMASCDCYVSLHRSEGLGLTMAEAMYFGRPVIATGYSGNLDFMTEENSYLVPYELTEIGPDANPYPPDKEWAEPDVERAAALMREVYENPEEAEARGRQAAADIRRNHSPQAAAEAIGERIEKGRRARLAARFQPPSAARATVGAPAGRDLLEHLLHVDVASPPAGAGRAQAEAKRLYMRLLRPYAAHQQRINTTVAESLDEIRVGLTELLRMQEETDGELARMREDVEGRLSRADALADAAAATPYMADERIARRTHPLLGDTVGFHSTEERGGYRSFEDLFRGPEEMIRSRQSVYLDLLGDRQPVLDAGCGRGEFLDLLAERGIPGRGVDLDPEMVQRCREKGHDVEQGSLLAALEATPPASLGAIFSAQVVEHLDFGELRELLRLALSRLQPGGLLIAETVNPHSAAALKAFWVDPSHVQPLFPETMLALCSLAGFAEGDAFAPLGSGDWERDRTTAGEYAVVATAPAE